VQYLSDEGRAGRFTAAPDAISRVRVDSTSRVA